MINSKAEKLCARILSIAAFKCAEAL